MRRQNSSKRSARLAELRRGISERLARIVFAWRARRLASSVKPSAFADVAQRRARAITDDFCRHRRVAAPVAFVDVLDDLLAVLMREVDIDVGNLLSLFGHEALEEQIHPDRIDRGDAERVADGGVGGRAAPLAEHAETMRRPVRYPTR